MKWNIFLPFFQSPVNKDWTPFVRTICLIDEIIVWAPFCKSFFVRPRVICRCVLTTSKGSVSVAAIDPDKAPDMKLIESDVRIRLVRFKSFCFISS